MPADAPRFLTPTDVADILNVTIRQVRTLLHAGDLRGIQVGPKGIWRVEAVELEDYIQRQYARADEALAEVDPAADAASTSTDVRSS